MLCRKAQVSFYFFEKFYQLCTFSLCNKSEFCQWNLKLIIVRNYLSTVEFIIYTKPYHHSNNWFSIITFITAINTKIENTKNNYTELKLTYIEFKDTLVSAVKESFATLSRRSHISLYVIFNCGCLVVWPPTINGNWWLVGGGEP